MLWPALTGTGKTSWLSRVIENRAKEYGSDKVVATSFTRAAAVELMGRDLPVPKERVGTLHALCYRMMGKPTIAETKLSEWNEHCAWYHALTGNKANIDEPAEYEGKSRGDEALRQCQVLRARMIPVDAWPMTVQSFYKRWREWKDEAGYIDFTDMIDFGLAEMDTAPGRPDFLSADESQDFSRLELSLLRKWGEQTRDFVVVGDEDQCLPSGTLIRTATGSQAIETIKPGDFVYSSHGCQRSLGWGLVSRVGARRFCGDLCEITTQSGKRFRCTGDHEIPAKWPRKMSHNSPWTYLYLMKHLDGRYRLGITDDPAQRQRLENGLEGILPLRAYLNRENARRDEMIYSLMFQIPTILFAPRGSELNEMSQDSLDAIFYAVQDIEGSRRLMLGFDKEWKGYIRPQGTVSGKTERRYVYLDALDAGKGYDQLCYNVRYESGGERIRKRFKRLRKAREYMKDLASRRQAYTYERWCLVGRHRMEKIPARNILPGILLAVEKSKLKLRTEQVIEVKKVPYEGVVHDIEVEGTHNFLLDNGIVVGNCLYHFKGSDPTAFLNPPLPDDRKTFLRQSYRVPRTVCDLSQKWIRQLKVREDKPYKPRDADGVVDYRADVRWKDPEAIVRMLERIEGTVMVLTSCGYMLKPLLRLMREQGIPYHNSYRKSRGDWNPRLKADLILSYLRPEKSVWGSEARMWTYEDLQGWVPLVRAKGILLHGGKKWVKEHEGRLSVTEMLEHVFEEQALSAAFDGNLSWLEDNLLNPSPYSFAVYRKLGANGLREAPRLTTGTIHSVKGGESDNVLLFPDLSMRAMKQWVSNRRDAIIRQFYVGMTRTREQLVLCGPSGSLNVELR